MKRRVVITGTGVVSTFGTGTAPFWNALKEGRCGITTVTRFDTSDMPTKVASEVRDFDPMQFIDKKEVRRMDRYAQYAVAAAQLAVDDGGLDVETINRERFGVIIGSGIGGIETMEQQAGVLGEKGPGRVSAFFVPMMIPNMASGLVSIRFGAKGFNECVVSACATSTNAIGDAYKVIARGDADVILAGGAEAAVTRLAFAGFCSNKAMTTCENPEEACRPFDAERDGFVLGEGAGVLLLEDYDHAVARGASILAEVAGYACTNDAFHITAPAEHGEGGARCMALALKDAGIVPEDIGYINAHGTSTPPNDKNESMAIRTVFGSHADKLAVSSTKSMTGHLLGAAGAVEAIACACALKEGFLPPTINYRHADPDCTLDYVPNKGRQSDIRYALSNSFGFGGHNATLILRRV